MKNINISMKLFILIITFITINKSSFSQSCSLIFKEPAVLSPNASAIQNFIDVPVDFCTGIPKINIPIYTINEGGIQVPITLSYHNGGFKPGLYPSWVGMGWTLFAGGSISRVINGGEDESNTSSSAIPNAGYYYNTNILNSSDWSDFSNTSNNDIILDTEPDEFSFSFNGISGKFYLDENKKWKVFSEREIKVIFNETTDLVGINEENENPLSLGGALFWRFILITEDGTRYIFGGERTAIEFSRYQSEGDKVPVATSWYLTSIISPNGKDHIDFHYSRESMDMILNLYNTSNYSLLRIYDSNGILISNQSNSSGSNLKGSLTEPSYLSSIITTNQEINFVYSNANCLPINKYTFPLTSTIIDKYEDLTDKSNVSGYKLNQYNLGLYSPFKKLNSIIVSLNNANKEEIEKIDFTYIENPNERLKLKDISFGKLNKYFEKFQFEYYSNYLSAIPYITDKIDHWGYYNNITPAAQTVTSQTLSNISSYQNNIDSYYLSRNSSQNINVLEHGLLKKIVYPTGGFQEFTYEQNDYSEKISRTPKYDGYTNIIGINSLNLSIENNNDYCGGIRLKSISNSEGITKKYYYRKGIGINDNETEINQKLSSGQLQSEISYIKTGSRYTTDLGANNYKICDFGDFSSNSLFYLFSNNGSHVLYSEVTEFISGADNGMIKYYFSLPTSTNSEYFDELPISSINNSYYSNLTNNALIRGKLLKQIKYSNSGAIKNEIDYEYNNSDKRLIKKIRTKSISQSTFNVPTGQIWDVKMMSYYGSANYIYYYNNYLRKTTEKTYDSSGNYLEEINEYKYGDVYDKLLKEKVQKDSKDHILKTTYTYPTDIGLLPTEDYRENLYESSLANWNELRILYDTCYKQCRSNYSDPEDWTLCVSENCVEPGSKPSLDEFSTFTPQINSTSEPVYNLITNHRIMPLEVLNYKDDNIIGGTIFKYELFNTNQAELSSELVLNLENPLSNSNFSKVMFNPNTGDLIYDSKYDLNLKIDKYDSFGNAEKLHEKDLIYKNYIWGYNHQYPIAKIESSLNTEININVNDNNLSGSDVLSDIQTDISYLKSLLSTYINDEDYMVTLYTYKPLVGITSMTDPRGVTTFYKYDAFNRLESTKDKDGNVLQNNSYHYANEQ